jgi:hypothetical protein
MIVDSPLIIGLVAGAGRIIPQDGDAQLIVPALVQPTVDLVQPNVQVDNINTPMTQSFMIANLLQRAAGSATLSQIIATLAPGLWHLTLTWSYRTNSTFVAILNDTNSDVTITPVGAVEVTLLQEYAQPNIMNHHSLSLEFLNTANAAVRHGVAATGAASTIESYVTLIAVRRI